MLRSEVIHHMPHTSFTHHCEISVELPRFCFGRFLFVSLLVFYCFGIVAKTGANLPICCLPQIIIPVIQGGNFHSVKSVDFWET